MTTCILVGTVQEVTCVFYPIGSTTPTDPSTVVVKYKNPALTVTTKTYGVDVEVVRSTTGTYHVDIPLTAAGRWSVEFIGTGTVAVVVQVGFWVTTPEVDS